MSWYEGAMPLRYAALFGFSTLMLPLLDAALRASDIAAFAACYAIIAAAAMPWLRRC